MTIRIIIADDHTIVREGLKSLLEKVSDIEIVAEAQDGRMAVELVKSHIPDVVFVDIAMPYLSGIQAIEKILDISPETKIIVLSMHSDKRFVTDALREGAKGYMVKECAAEEIIQAIRVVVSGQVYLSPVIASQVVEDYLLNIPDRGEGYNSLLTNRECEVLQLIAKGNTNKEIALALGLSIKTIETHRQRVMTKLNLFNVAELTKFAIREGLISMEK